MRFPQKLSEKNGFNKSFAAKESKSHSSVFPRNLPIRKVPVPTPASIFHLFGF